MLFPFDYVSLLEKESPNHHFETLLVCHFETIGWKDDNYHALYNYHALFDKCCSCYFVDLRWFCILFCLGCEALQSLLSMSCFGLLLTLQFWRHNKFAILLDMYTICPIGIHVSYCYQVILLLIWVDLLKSSLWHPFLFSYW